jgi:hypothetical protein
MNTNYYHISYRIDLGSHKPLYGSELINKTPLEYVIYWRNIGGHYGERVILFAEKITKEEYDLYHKTINEE